MLLDQEGRYKATVTSAGLHRKGPNNLLCFTAYYKADEWKNGDTYEPVEGGEYGLLDDMYLEKTAEKGGGLSDANIKRLAQVFEWDGDLMTLAAAVTGAKCKITVKNRTYNGKTTPEVQWLNHINDGDGGGGAVKHDEQVASQAARTYGAKIRAILGSAPAPRPAAAPPARPASAPPRPAPAAPATQLGLVPPTADGVWAAFEVEMKRQQVPPDQHEAAWFAFLKEVAGATDTASVSNWAPLIAALPSWTFLPF